MGAESMWREDKYGPVEKDQHAIHYRVEEGIQ
jgi:hypothetical protein